MIIESNPVNPSKLDKSKHPHQKNARGGQEINRKIKTVSILNDTDFFLEEHGKFKFWTQNLKMYN